MSTPMERDAAIVSAVLDHLRAERDEARTELAELRTELAEANSLLGTRNDKIRVLARQRDDARAAGEALMRDKARDTAPALAGDALREALCDAVSDVLVDRYGPDRCIEAELSTVAIVAAIMPIVGRAALAARSAFPAPPFTMDHTFGYTPVPAEPERELRIQRHTLGGWPAWRGQCSRCAWVYHTHSHPDDVEIAFDRHKCADYSLTDETEGQ